MGPGQAGGPQARFPIRGGSSSSSLNRQSCVFLLWPEGLRRQMAVKAAHRNAHFSWGQEAQRRVAQGAPVPAPACGRVKWPSGGHLANRGRALPPESTTRS